MVEHSFAIAYSKEENGIVERANQEVMRHLRAMRFDARVHDKWSFEQLPMVKCMPPLVKWSFEQFPPSFSLSLQRACHYCGYLLRS
jgi:hypothetical protein